MYHVGISLAGRKIYIKIQVSKRGFLPVFITVTKQKMVKNGDVNNRIAEHHFRRRNIESTGTLRCMTYSTDRTINDSL